GRARDVDSRCLDVVAGCGNVSAGERGSIRRVECDWSETRPGPRRRLDPSDRRPARAIDRQRQSQSDHRLAVPRDGRRRPGAKEPEGKIAAKRHKKERKKAQRKTDLCLFAFLLVPFCGYFLISVSNFSVSNTNASTIFSPATFRIGTPSLKIIPTPRPNVMPSCESCASPGPFTAQPMIERCKGSST